MRKYVRKVKLKCGFDFICFNSFERFSLYGFTLPIEMCTILCVRMSVAEAARSESHHIDLNEEI